MRQYIVDAFTSEPFTGNPALESVYQWADEQMK